MLLKEIANFIFLNSLLWLLVKGDTNEDIDVLLKANKEISNPSTNDEIEFNQQRKKLEDAKQLNTDARKEDAIKEFNAYQSERDFLKEQISALIPKAGNVVDLTNILQHALDGSNRVKEFAVEFVEEQLSKAGQASSASNTTSFTSIDSLLDAISKWAQSGGITFSPNLHNQINTYNPISSQANDNANYNEELKKLLIMLLKKWESLNNDTDDDWFNLFEWF
ncbi:uncharacterized protein LOC129253197 [Anastrepha obliqua]|uniref:uncharacterized protein LOC129253197 n=1 Tax=Anastrepha obliqua TaxID=95512 RepID=UPI0024098229|nr:uncharacterized protein LOC129253197 [Anastrepha obliqua]